MRPTRPERARQLIDASQNLVVATVDAAGVPWISPLFYVPDARYDLYWTSERTAKHSANLRATGVAAIVIYATDPGQPVDAVYMAAEVTELTDPVEIAAAITVMAAKPQPQKWTITSIEDVSGTGPWRIYRAHPTSVDVRTSAESGGKPVARRAPAEFRTAGEGREVR